KKLKERVLPRTGRVDRRRGRIGLLLPRKGAEKAYGGKSVHERIKDAASICGFEFVPIEIPFVHNAEFALALDGCEAVVLDVAGEVLPTWVFSYVHGRLIPSIKL